MNRYALIVTFCAIQGGLHFSFPSQESSDLQAAKSFRLRYNATDDALRASKSLESCRKVQIMVNNLEREFSSQASFINKVLYPKSFEQGIADLRRQLQLLQKRLSTIVRQKNEIEQWKTRKDSLRIAISTVETHQKGLKELVFRLTNEGSESNIDSLRRMIEQMLVSVPQRDGMVLDFVHGLFILEAETSFYPPRIQIRTGDWSGVYGSLSKALHDNIDIVNWKALSGRDLVTLKKEQNRFQSRWQGLRGRLTEVYPSTKGRENVVNTIDSLLLAWGENIESKFWSQLNFVMTRHRPGVRESHNGNQLYSNISSFVEDAVRNVQNLPEDVRFKDYQEFHDLVWTNELVPHWIPLLKERGDLSDSAVQELERKLQHWEMNTHPPRWTLRIIWTGTGLLGGLLLRMWYIRRKKNKMDKVSVDP
jgi:hypothetical protein